MLAPAAVASRRCLSEALAAVPEASVLSAEGLLVPPELEWALVRAFGEAAESWTSPLDGPVAVTTATRIGLLPRIVHRLGPARLAAEIGPEAAKEALAAYRESALASAKLVGLARLVGRVAGENGIRVVALKHAALCLSGICSPAERGAVDADVLVSDADAARLTAALVSAGILISEAPGYDHQHRPLVHRQAGMLELHRTVPGVRATPSDPEASLEVLAGNGLATALAPGEPCLLVPRPHVLLAHALAHALFQHGLEPGAYPPFKLLADVADLRRSAGDGLLGDALPLVAAEVNEDDARAAWELPSLLSERGVAAVLARPESAEARLLAHLVRGAFEPEYAASIRIRSVLALPSDRAGLGGLLSGAWHALAISRAQARNLYGTKSLAGYVLVLAWRPFHLAGKLVRYAVAALR